MPKAITVSIKASLDGKKTMRIIQGENKIKLTVPQARMLASRINRKFGKSFVQ